MFATEVTERSPHSDEYGKPGMSLITGKAEPADAYARTRAKLGFCSGLYDAANSLMAGNERIADIRQFTIARMPSYLPPVPQAVRFHLHHHYPVPARHCPDFPAGI